MSDWETKSKGNYFMPSLEQNRRLEAVLDLSNRVYCATGKRPLVIEAAPNFFQGVNPIECCGIKIRFVNLPDNTIIART